MSGEIGHSYLTIIPKFDGLTASVNKALGSVNAQTGGAKVGDSASKGFNSGIAKGGAIAGTFAVAVDKAMSVISSSVGNAVSRIDTLKNYPVVMQALGYSAESSQASIQKMSDRLQNLPTRLDTMASTVSGLVSVTHDIDRATNAGLAINDMLLASASSQQLASAAMEQFRQMLAKGKPDMQDWRSLVQAMPGQMDQLAKSMLGPTANANDLYIALGGGDASKGGASWGTISMDQLIDKIIELDEVGGEGFASFQQQAETAQAGIQTALDNTANAVVRGMADVMDAIGRENIVAPILEVKQGINDISASATVLAKDALPHMQSLWSLFKEIGPAAVTLGGGALSMKGLATMSSMAGKTISSFSGLLGTASKISLSASGTITRSAVAFGGLSKMASGAAAIMGGPYAAAIGLGIVGLAALSLNIYETVKANQQAESATKGLSDAIGNIEGISTSAAKASEIEGNTIEQAFQKASQSAERAAEAHKNYLEVGSKAASSIQGIATAAQSQMSSLEYAGNVIDAYAGKTGLSAAQQDEFKRAIDTVNQACGTNYEVIDASSGKYADEAGNIQTSTEAIWKNIDARKASIKLQAISDSKAEAEKVYTASLEDKQAQQKSLGDSYNAYKEVMNKPENKGKRTSEISQFTPDGKVINQYLQSAQAYKNATDAAHTYAVEIANLGEIENVLAKQASGTELSISDLAKSTNAAMSAFQEGGSKASLSLASFGEAVAACAENQDKLKEVMNDPETMAAIVSNYDGSAASLRDIFNQLGIGFDEVKAKQVDAAKSLEDMSQFIDSLEGDVTGAIASMGYSGDTMAAKLAAMGVSMQDLNNIGSESFADMVENCGGDINTLATMIELYNSKDLEDKNGRISVITNDLTDAEGTIYTYNGTELTDKDGNVVVDEIQLQNAQGDIYTWNGSELIDKNGNAAVFDATLIDAQQNLYTWNGSILLDKSGNVAIENTELVDSQSRLWIWNGTSLVPKSTFASVDHSSVDAAASARDDWNRSGLKSHTATATIDIFRNIHDIFSGGGSGGAWGGIIRKHADGGIRRGNVVVNSPGSGVPIDLVGEAGPEAIVPLTSKYSRPFVSDISDAVAQRMHEREGGDSGTQAIIEWLSHSLPIIIAKCTPVMSKREFERMVMDYV